MEKNGCHRGRNEKARRTKNELAAAAKAVFCYVAVRPLGIKGVQVGEFLSMGQSGVSRDEPGGASRRTNAAKCPLVREKLEMGFAVGINQQPQGR